LYSSDAIIVVIKYLLQARSIGKEINLFRWMADNKKIKAIYTILEEPSQER